MESGELDFAKHAIGWWPWIITGTYSLLITIFAVPAMIKASPSRLPVSPIIVVGGGAALLMTLCLVQSKPPIAERSPVKVC
jgi:hypothetical protein